MNKLIKYTLGILGYVVIMAPPVAAFSDAVYIQDLPEYMNYQVFKVSYTAISESPVTAKFLYKKDGDSGWTELSTTTGYAGETQLTGSQISEQKKYYFRVETTSASGSASDETSTFYDASGPSPVNSYSKEKISDGAYRLHWKNPTDTDFSRVFIYRSDNSVFTADDSSKVAEKGGAYDTEQTWDNSGLELNKTYYYAIRAVDKAGNPSSVVADSDSQVQVLGVAATAGGESKVASLPKEDKGGSVLGEEETKDESKASENAQDGGLIDSIKSIGYPKLIVLALIVLGLGTLIMGYLKKEKE